MSRTLGRTFKRSAPDIQSQHTKHKRDAGGRNRTAERAGRTSLSGSASALIVRLSASGDTAHLGDSQHSERSDHDPIMSAQNPQPQTRVQTPTNTDSDVRLSMASCPACGTILVDDDRLDDGDGRYQLLCRTCRRPREVAR